MEPSTSSAFAPLVPDPAEHPNGWPLRLRVCGQPEARRHCAEWGASHVVTIKSEKLRYFGPSGYDPDKQLVLHFTDTSDPEHPEAPTIAHVEAISTWVDALPADAALVLHCLRGLSRSPAMVLGLLAREVPPVRAGYLLHALRPEAEPNRLLVKLWDDHLGLGGVLVRVGRSFPTAVWRHGDGEKKAPPERKRKQA